MTAARIPHTVRRAPKRAPRRLARDARLEQLVDIAMPIVAERGLGTFSLDEIAEHAGVTRNLLYHYFPRGRADILVAVGERAGHELTDGWITDESIPIEERMAGNFVRFINHATKPTDAWRIHRIGRASQDPELAAIAERFEEIVIESVSINNFGTRQPPPMARLAIKGFIAFAETVLDEARETAAPPEQVVQLVAQSFAKTLEAAIALKD
jgi:AcrR family transcriptional regulator